MKSTLPLIHKRYHSKSSPELINKENETEICLSTKEKKSRELPMSIQVHDPVNSVRAFFRPKSPRSILVPQFIYTHTIYKPQLNHLNTNIYLPRNPRNQWKAYNLPPLVKK